MSRRTGGAAADRSDDDVDTAGEGDAERAGIFRRLYYGDTDFTFVSRWRIWFGVSGAIVLAGLVALATMGLNLGIDFTGGNQWEVPARGTTVAEARDAVSALGFSAVEVQEVGDDLRIQTETLEGSETERREANDEVVTSLMDLTGAERNDVAVNEVGPSWGREISEKALRALVFFLVAIVIYITIRFEFRMALGTLGALVHDILVVVGVYSLFQLPVTPATVVAFLTVLGFSIYDGIVVFDRVDENTRLLTASSKLTYSDVVDRSLNEVLMRTLNTQITSVIPILSVLLVGSVALGAATLQEFGLALFIGQISGAYSSIFIASPMLALLKEREPRYRALRQRVAGRSAPRPKAKGASTPEEADGDAAVSAPPGGAEGPRSTTRSHPPRPRKKGKRR